MTDEIFMREDLQIVKHAEGRTSPNPMVGAVIVRDGRIVAQGWHRKVADIAKNSACDGSINGR